MSWFNKKKQTITESKVCLVDQNLPECSLVEQLRKLQKQQDELSIRITPPNINDFFDLEYINHHLIYKSVLNFNELPLCYLKKVNEYSVALIEYKKTNDDIHREKSEIEKQISDIKSQLDIK